MFPSAQQEGGTTDLCETVACASVPEVRWATTPYNHSAAPSSCPDLDWPWFCRRGRGADCCSQWSPPLRRSFIAAFVKTVVIHTDGICFVSAGVNVVDEGWWWLSSFWVVDGEFWNFRCGGFYLLHSGCNVRPVGTREMTLHKCTLRETFTAVRNNRHYVHLAFESTIDRCLQICAHSNTHILRCLRLKYTNAGTCKREDI